MKLHVVCTAPAAPHTPPPSTTGRGLYGVLIVDDPAEPGRFDREWVVVLDDWVDGTGRTPDDVLASFVAMSGSGGGGMTGHDMPGMDHGSLDIGWDGHGLGRRHGRVG